MTGGTHDLVGAQPGFAVGAAEIVDDPAEITAALMTGVLRAGGSDAEVTGVRFEPVGTGQTAVSYRFHLDYAGDPGDTAGPAGVAPAGVGPASAGPASVVVKMAAGAPDVRRRLRNGFRNEVGFYSHFAHRALIRMPRCWSAALSGDSLRFTLVLQDAYPARAGSQLAGCTPAQATLAVQNLAGLHAPFWNDEHLRDDAEWLARPGDSGLAYLGKVATAAADGFTGRYREQLGPRDTETLLRAARLVAGWGRHTATRHTLLHGDYRLDNLLFAGDSRGSGGSGDSGADVLAVDWQTVEAGFPGRDLAYFVSTALAPADRRTHEAALVAAYHQRLVEHGVPGYTVDDCFEDYRRGMLQGPLITMIGCVYASAAPTESSDRMFLSMAANACAAIQDLGVLDLLAS
ncbi:protein of unknown function (DUF227) [Frankia sp. EI5c]|uniref:oxidoreductase family protein n=1 Tax=Frankia sp. EI5c TaxID=683316 RepID=UPI0007C3864A|nr:oxidoreductase family protein [Frankia sp. EI5c]OAA27922.1 protein of unknown function (DUF227) [Frankia sp. EI5c]